MCNISASEWAAKYVGRFTLDGAYSGGLIDSRRSTVSAAFSDGDTPSIHIERWKSIAPGLNPGNVYEMRKAFYNNVAKAQSDVPVGERSKGMTLEEIRVELLMKK